MKRVLHLSDLHYGKDRADLEDPLLKTIDRLAPDLVAISGDFTQRARRGQFDRAATFLDRLSVPWLAVPGNHDTPLDNLWVRLTKPWKRYKRAIHGELEPVFEDDGMVVVGVNTVNRFAWQRGKLSNRRVKRACRAFGDHDERSRLVMLHHPLQHGPEVEKRLMAGADDALKAFAECGAQIVLSGHLHNTVISPFRAWPQLLFVQAGTCLSSRVRGEENMFNVLDLTADSVRVESWGAENLIFSPRLTRSFFIENGQWVRRDGPLEA
ncbi:3',5'-cyclic AMP phosphodiesterase CpdA [Sagittula marina]|uniref:3',5'-cyclic AMP phosphodiesterase CpdA n=1 Tax=Sagittula marina TaxID=943940 RepID=A0A7W6DRE7_9RHOB|nr:metallophosphoesterase [Sagittula marina]MBB3983789.1 3',5'-cyclic AMP phosphodiesterase CpdA [Sagittula marina]